MYQIFYRSPKLLLLGAFLWFLNESNAQSIDSLKQVLQGSSGANKFDVLFSLSRASTAVSWDDAFDYANQANELALELSDSLRIVKSYRLKAQILRRLDKLDDAIRTFETAFAIAKRNQRDEGYLTEIKYILNGLAIGHTFLANYDKALDFHFQSLVIREKEGDEAEISVTLNNIGIVYFKMRNYEKAKEYFGRSLVMKNEVKDTYDLDRLLINLGMANIHLRNFDEAMDYINRGLSTCGEKCNDDVVIEGEFGLGVANFGLEEMAIAKKHFEKSFQIAKTSGNKRFQAENLVYFAKIAIVEKDTRTAENNLKIVEPLADSAGYNQLLIDTYKQFSILYGLMKDFENASAYQNKYIHLKDSLIGEELVKNIAKIQTNFEERENIATIKLKEEALVRQRNLNFALGTIAALIGLLGFVLYRSNVVTRKVNTALSDAKGIIETQNLRLQNINRELDGKVKEKTADLLKANTELDTANQSLSRVNDELDNFIYKTSHDIRGPLASLKGICSVALMDVKDPLALDYLEKLDVSSGRLNVILTRLLIVNQINNAIVGHEEIDFKSIVDDVILLEKKKGLPPRFEIKKDIQADATLQSDKDLVRIILENLIDNAIKFHNDSERTDPFVHIKISSEDQKGVRVSVVDNGIGIAEARPDKIFQMFSRASERSGTGGIGLYLSKLATEKLGGEIHLRTTPEGHTEFYVYFPMKATMA
ncbi:MAG TPA: tetratricopeptide repeat-containing sensor histidine kinase [Cyclobacteriaceae bacterium]|nr:tetratricopeptide repeat-containing sensor histidine kinase [Cyclobacteriaceae bacterium]